MIPQTKINVYYEDFKDFPGLHARLNHFVHGKQPLLEILAITTNFITIAGSDVLIHALYHPDDGYPGKA